jgi:2-hydroxycyclohexanecarboxyl-CoA dehydrogenase
MVMELGFKGKVAIVTGSGRGIGRGIAIALAAEGASVAINDFYAERAQAVADEITAKGGSAIAAPADVTQAESVQQMVDKVVAAWGTVHILVNNAGIPAGVLETDPLSAMKTFMDTTRADWEKWVNLDFFGVMNCCKAVLPYMAKQRYGKIASIISDAGRVGEPGQTVYSGVKAGIVGFTKALAKEVARYEVNVNCVAPSATTGTFLSELMGTDVPRNAAEQDRLDKILKVYPLGRSKKRLGSPTDLANAVCFFVSDASEWVTGQVLSVNGGYCMVD